MKRRKTIGAWLFWIGLLSSVASNGQTVKPLPPDAQAERLGRIAANMTKIAMTFGGAGMWLRNRKVQQPDKGN